MTPAELVLHPVLACTDPKIAAAVVGVTLILSILLFLREALIQIIDDPADFHDNNPGD